MTTGVSASSGPALRAAGDAAENFGDPAVPFALAVPGTGAAPGAVPGTGPGPGGVPGTGAGASASAGGLP